MVLLSGCSQQQDVYTQIEYVQQDIQIDLYYRQSNEIFFNDIVTAYNKKYPDLPVIQYPVNNTDYLEVITSKLAAGEAIDVFDSGNITEYANYVKGEYVSPMNDLIKRDAIDMVPYGPLVSEITMGGEIYGLPFITSTWVLFYNKDIFDQQGVAYPSDDMTWTQFRHLASKVTKNTEEGVRYGAYFHTWPQSWYGLALQTGASIIDVDLSPFKEALQYRINIEKDGVILPYSQALEQSKHYRQVFIDEEVAMVPMGEWMIEHLRTAEREGIFAADWDIVPIPHPEGVEPNITWGMSAQLLIYNQSSKKEEAWNFIKFSAGETGAQIFARNGRLPAYQNSQIKEIFTSQDSKPENIHIIFDQKVYMEMPAIPDSYDYDEILREEGEKALLNQYSVDEAIERIRERVTNR